MCKRSNYRKVTDIVALHISNQKVSKKKKRKNKKGFQSLYLLYCPQLQNKFKFGGLRLLPLPVGCYMYIFHAYFPANLKNSRISLRMLILVLSDFSRLTNKKATCHTELLSHSSSIILQTGFAHSSSTRYLETFPQTDYSSKFNVPIQ